MTKLEEMAAEIRRIYRPRNSEDEHYLGLAAARAALKAMREPSEKMVDAADAICPIARGTESHRIGGGRVPEDYWSAMIDAALEEGDG